MILLKAFGTSILLLFIMWIVLPTIWFLIVIFTFGITFFFIFTKLKAFRIDSKVENAVNVIDTLSSLPISSKLFGISQYNYLKKELLWMSNEYRNIQQLRNNNRHDITDVDTTIHSKVSISNARAQAHANATVFAPFLDKEAKQVDLEEDVNIDTLNRKKVKIRKEFTEKVNEYNRRVDNLTFWRNAMFRDWYLDQLGFPKTSCFPKHIVDGIN